MNQRPRKYIDYGILRAHERVAETAQETLLNHKEDIKVMSLAEIRRGCEDTKPLCEERHNPHKVKLRDGAEMYCEDYGEGIPIITIHGGPGATHHTFHNGGSFDMLSEQGFRILHLDMRGCGESDMNPGADGKYSIEQAARDLKDVLDEKGIEKAVFAAHSFGNTVLHRFAELFPDRVVGMALIAPYCAEVPVENKTPHKKYITEAEQARMDACDTSSSEGIIQRIQAGAWLRQFFFRPTKEGLFRIKYEWKHDPTFPDQMNADSKARVDPPKVFDKNIPTRIFWGEHDWTLPGTPESLQRFFKGATVCRFRHSSHCPYADEPEKFVELMKDFVSSIPHFNLKADESSKIAKEVKTSIPDNLNNRAAGRPLVKPGRSAKSCPLDR